MLRRALGLLCIAALAACSTTQLGPARTLHAPPKRVLMVTLNNFELAQTLTRALNDSLAALPGSPQVELSVLNVVDRPSVTTELKRLQIRPGQFDAVFVDSVTWARAAQILLPNVPIVFEGVSDPVARCVVNSLKLPGRNATGYMHYFHADGAKRIDALQIAFPQRREVLQLVDHINVQSPGCDETSRYWTDPEVEACVAGPRKVDDYLRKRVDADELTQHAQHLGMTLTFVVLCNLDDLSSLKQWGGERPSAGWVVSWQDRINANRERVVEALNATGQPAVYPHHGFVRVGGLMSLAATLEPDVDRPSVQALVQVVLGHDPATLPVQMPRGFTLNINHLTAERLALQPSLESLRLAHSIIQ